VAVLTDPPKRCVRLDEQDKAPTYRNLPPLFLDLQVGRALPGVEDRVVMTAPRRQPHAAVLGNEEGIINIRIRADYRARDRQRRPRCRMTRRQAKGRPREVTRAPQL